MKRLGMITEIHMREIQQKAKERELKILKTLPLDEVLIRLEEKDTGDGIYKNKGDLKHIVRGDLLLWLDCFGKDWVDLNKYMMVDHAFSSALEMYGLIEVNLDEDLAPHDTLLRISDKGLAYLGMKNREEKIKLEGEQDG